MSTTETPTSSAMLSQLVTAEVLGYDATGQNVRVSLSSGWDETTLWARLATGPNIRPQVGDQVLIAGNASEQLFVIGCLSPPCKKRVMTDEGTFAECTSSDGHETVRVVSKDNELLFEHDPARGLTRLAVPKGALELTTASGDLILNSAGQVRISGAVVDVRARQQLSLQVLDVMGKAKSWFRLLQDRLQSGGQKLEVDVDESVVRSRSSRLTSDELAVTATNVSVCAKRLESNATTRIERSGNVYQTVTDLLQHQVGRLRTYVAGFSHHRSKQAYISAEETINIDGEKVNLG